MRRPNTVTPIRLQLAKGESVSSTGSSVNSYNTFDTDLTRESTPITPPETFEFQDKRSLGSSKSDHVVQTLLDSEDVDPFLENGPATKPSMTVPIPKVNVEYSHVPENSCQKTEEQALDSVIDEISARIHRMQLRSCSPFFDEPETNDSPTSSKAKRRSNKGRSSSTESPNEIQAIGNTDALGLDKDVGPSTAPANTTKSSKRVAEDDVPIHTSTRRLKSAHANNLLRRDGHLRSHSTPPVPTKLTANDDSDAFTLNNRHATTEPPIEGQDQPANLDHSIDSGIAENLKSSRRTSRKASTTSLPISQVKPACAESRSDSPASISGRRTLKPPKITRKRGVSSPEIPNQSDLDNKEGSKSEPNLLHSSSQGDINVPFRPKLARFNIKESTINEIKNNILRKIRENRPEKGAKKPYTGDPGFIYIFTSPKYPGYVKIGKTKHSSKDRINEWATNCNFTCHHVEDPYDKMFDHHSTIEKLIQEELCNERRVFECWECKSKTKHKLKIKSKLKLSRKRMSAGERTHKAELVDAETSEDDSSEDEVKGDESNKTRSKGTQHGEWFEITEVRAKEVVDRWRKWIVEGRPYKKNGTLTRHWQWKQKWANDSKEEINWDTWVLSSLDDATSYAVHSVDQELRELWPNLVAVLKSSGFLTVAAALIIWHVFGRGYLGFTFGIAAVFALFYLSIRYD